MAKYKYSNLFTQSDDAKFDTVHDPGQDAPFPGIYRCLGCNKEIALASGHKLPPQNHHQHSATQGKIRWRLVVTHD